MGLVEYNDGKLMTIKDAVDRMMKDLEEQGFCLECYKKPCECKEG